MLTGETREIARDLRVSRNTVRKVRSGETAFEYERNVQPRPKLGRWTAELDDLLSSNAAKPAREQLTLIRIFEELRGRGHEGGYDAVRRYAGRWVPQDGHLTSSLDFQDARKVRDQGVVQELRQLGAFPPRPL